MLHSLYNNPARVKRGLIAALGVATILVVFLAVRQSTQGTLQLIVVPNDATITTSKGLRLKDGANTLRSGTYTISITRPHFEKQTFSVTIKAGQTAHSSYALAVADAAGLQYFADHPDQQLIATGITGQKIDAISNQVARQQPLVNVLPVLGLNWRIDAGQSKKYPTDPTKVAVYITAPDTANQNDAINWITSHGYRLSDYEILYQDLATYNQEVNPGTAPPPTASDPSPTPAPPSTSGEDYN